jgi:two-component system chemotaxis response regulator CheB
MSPNLDHIKAVFIGTSAGGVTALNFLFRMLPENFSVPIIVVLHLGENAFIPSAFYNPPGVNVLEAEEKIYIKAGNIYFAPPDYHLLVEEDKTFSLSTEEKVKFARPSLDVTMDTLADAYGDKILSIILTGANDDGAEGQKKIKDKGGITIVQNITEALYKTMPEAAINKTIPDLILTLEEIGNLLKTIKGKK